MSEHRNWGELLIKGLEEALEHARGERPDLRVVRYVANEDGSLERVESQGSKPRAGWDEAFGRMAGRGDDRLLDDTPSTSAWDDEEWEWPGGS